MPYDPANADLFRNILNKLAEEEVLSSQKIIDIVHEARKGKRDLPAFSLSRFSLDRFRKGDRIENTGDLRQLWSVLEAHVDYGHRFPKEVSTNAVENPWPMAFAQFMLGENSWPSQQFERLAQTLPGQYVMWTSHFEYTPPWSPKGPFRMARATHLEIASTDRALTISETQDFLIPETEFRHRQRDVGALAPAGNFLYFLMKDDRGGSSVKFGLVQSIYPYNHSSPVERINGIIFESDHLNIYPPSQFSCLRLTEDKEYRPGLINIWEIEDAIARVNLRNPLSLPIQLRSSPAWVV